MSNFWDVIWFIIVAFAFIAYLMVMFSIIGDLFRDHQTSGVVKAIWIVGLIFLPFLTALVYLIARGQGMAERQMKTAQQMQDAQRSYIQQAAGSNPADQIATARKLLDDGIINQSEFDSMKSKALAG